MTEAYAINKNFLHAIIVLLSLLTLLSLLNTFLLSNAVNSRTLFSTNATPTPAAENNATDLTALKTLAKNFLDTKYLSARGLETRVNNASQKNGLFELSVDIVRGDKIIESTTVFITLDGKKIILGNAMDLLESSEVATPTPVPKLERPKLEFFVMSFCPYGKQAMQGISPVARLLGEKAVFEPRYVIYGKDHYGEQCEKQVEAKAFANAEECAAQWCLVEGQEWFCSMHGLNETRENARQLCVWKNAREKWWDYVDYVNANCSLSDVEVCWKTAARAAGLNETVVENCLNNDGASLLKAEYEECKRRGIRGSPTIFLNSVEYEGGRSALEFEAAVCVSFLKQPSECGEKLSSSTTPASGSCG